MPITSAPPEAAVLPRRNRKAQRGEARAGVLFALPWIIGMTLFVAIPLVVTFYIAQTKFQIIGAPKWVGMQNYEALWSDPDFWKSAQNTLIFAAI